MKVSNMTGKNGRSVPNQYVINTIENGVPVRVFQSYCSTIAKIIEDEVFLDEHFWDYSRTTSKYRNQFLDETTNQTQAKIKSGQYKLVNLN